MVKAHPDKYIFSQPPIALYVSLFYFIIVHHDQIKIRGGTGHRTTVFSYSACGIVFSYSACGIGFSYSACGIGFFESEIVCLVF